MYVQEEITMTTKFESEEQTQDKSSSSTERTTGSSHSGVQLKGKSFSEQQAALCPDTAGGFDAQQAALRPSPAIQLKGGDVQKKDIHEIAARGTQGSGSALPYGDAIQTAFGRHDVSSVQAYSGGAAAEANTAMGAEAYASGNNIAFKDTPSLHTAAHEAAHVVQQRAGVSLDGGVGKAGDSYEQHADSVADAVVSGQSAEGLLDQMAGGGGASGVQQKAVQMDTSADNMSEVGGSSELPSQDGSATVVGSATSSEYAFDNSFTPALIDALEKNPGLGLDDVLVLMGARTLTVNNAQPEHHPQIAQYGQTDDNSSVCRDSEHKAVLVANQNYTSINPLSTPIAEAGQLASELGARGYTTTQQNDQTAQQMDSHFGDTVSSLKEGDDAVLYYAGHGAEDGLVGINYSGQNNDMYTPSQVESVVSTATSRGAHIRFIMDSCHSGSVTDLVRSERLNELATQTADQWDSQMFVTAAQYVASCKGELGEHIHARANLLSNIRGAIRDVQAQIATNPTPVLTARLNALQNLQTRMTQMFDTRIQTRWDQMRSILAPIKLALGIATRTRLPALPRTPADYRTLGTLLDVLEAMENAAIAAVDRGVSEGTR